MRYILYLLAIAFFLWLMLHEDKPTVFTGYVVHKEWVKGHMCCSDAPTVNIAVVHPVIPPKHYHSWRPSEWNIYVANKTCLRTIHVDSLSWFCKYNCGQKVSITVK